MRRNGRHWTDLASGQRVRIRLVPADSRAGELAWCGECERLSNLRHPAMNALVDFGLVGRQMFEAYRTSEGPWRPRSQFLQHARRFLDAHDVAIADRREYLFRDVMRVEPALDRPLGVVLQRRDVLAAIRDALDAADSAGACAIAVRGPSGSGLRTMQGLAARAARLLGYVPLAASLAAAHRGLAEAIGRRHVCVFVDRATDDSAARAAALLSGLTTAGGRRHLVIQLLRDECPSMRSMPIDPLGVTAMTRMVFLDPDEGPAPEALFAAAREADGRPGLFLARLGGIAETRRRGHPVSMVHEATPEYAARPAPRGSLSRSEPTTRTAGAALRAIERSLGLARQGRHGAARRILLRATRLLRARGEVDRAAASAQARGVLALDRGQIAQAVEAFEEARDICPEGGTGIRAAIGIGSAWVEEGRLIEGEGALRNAVVAARSVGDPSLVAEAAALLARALTWQDRCDEAAAVLLDAYDVSLGDGERAAITLASARVHLVEGALPPASRAARAGLQLALAARDTRLVCAARRVLAETLLVAGDVEGCRDHVDRGIAAAQAGHLPLAAARLRVVLLDALTGSAEGAAIRRLAARLLKIGARVPPLLRFQIDAVCARALEMPPSAELLNFIRSSGATPLTRRTGLRPANPVADLEGFLQAGQTASDDRSALERMADELRQRVRAGSVLIAGGLPERAVLLVSGRAWPGDPQIAWRSLASGCPIPPDRTVEPPQASEPVRHGGQVVGAIACRWTAGTPLDTGRAMTLLRLAALATAPHLRALADRPVVMPGDAAWRDLLGESDVTQALRDAVVRSARAPFPVLIEGESGSGKELVARAIHRLGPRRERRFCAVNCAALSDDLLEAELFGHARGAFTGAIGDRAGLFEDADGGTLFLDEIGELSPRAQAKLLRVLQDGEVRRIGENAARRVDVRIVAATNRRLEQEAAAGRFRPDLRFRLDVVRIDVPPLRARPADVPLLAAHFWVDAAARVGSRATLSPEALAALARYDWPGNVRELQNVIAWMAVQSPRRGRIGSSSLPAHLARASTPVAATFEAARADFERRFVKAALARANGHRQRAAQSMGITRQGLAKMLRRLGLDEPDSRGTS